MKKRIYLIALAFLFSTQLIAQCPDGVAIKSITKPTSCTNTNGKFTIAVTPSSSPAVFESGYVKAGNTDTVWFSHTTDNNNITNKDAGIYVVIVRNIATKAICTKRDFVLSSNYAASFTNVSTAASACNVADGKIVLSGIAATDSVSWISSFTPAFTVASSLSPANTIPNLKTGLYYIIIKSPSGSQCFATDTTLVANSGTGANACPAPTLCTNAYGPNKFPNGTFGTGESLNGPALPAGETNYGYTQLAASGPQDGFYAIANSTDYNGATSGGSVFGKWVITDDHTPGDVNGYMMVVNASIDKDIVVEKTITGLCPNKTYQFSAFVKGIHTDADAIKPNLTFLIDGIGKYRTGDISGTTNWTNIGFTFRSSGTSAKFSIRNNNPGGTGNDWVIDDILVGVCAPTVAMNTINTTCINPATSLSATITDVSHIYTKYKWQVNSGSGFVDAVGGTGTGVFSGDSYTASLTPTPSPITDFQNGWTYRIIVAEDDADFSVSDCSYTNAQTLLIAQCGAILPVKISSLKAELNNTSGKVLWHVEEQINVKEYQLEKSTDGTNFTFVTSIAASSINNYSVNDNTLKNGINYYRIKSINNDGRYAYSSVVTLALKENTNTIKIFPNPVKDRLFIWMPNNTKINGITVLDAVGQKVIVKSAFNSSTNVSDIEVGKLPIGVYNIQIYTNKNEVKNCSFIKK